MAIKSSIEWTDATWNIARGCTKVDADCKNCYMYRDSLKGTRHDPKKVVRTKTVFNLPLKLKTPSRIFTCSLTDFFHPDIDSYRHEAWDIIRKCPQHTFQILTKRPERVMECLPADWGEGWANVWLGTSVGSNAGMHRLHELISLPAKLHFVSFEPLYEAIDMNLDIETLIRIDWAIIGGESGNSIGQYRYRPCKVEWIEEIAKAVQSVGNSVFIKQLGTHLAKKMGLKDTHGRDATEWPEHLRIRQFQKGGSVAEKIINMVVAKHREDFNKVYGEFI